MHGLAKLLRLASCGVMFCLNAHAATPVFPVQTGVWTHALTAYGEPKYKAEIGRASCRERV